MTATSRVTGDASEPSPGKAEACDWSQRPSRRFALAVIVVASLTYWVGLIYYAQTRPIDGDEGYYATAARLVWEGKTPYHDFFYQQTPLLPYLYSWIWGVHPGLLVAMRTQSAVFGGLAVFLWGIFLVFAKRLPAKLALATFAIVLLNPYWVAWHVVVKTYAVSNLLISVAIICLYWALHSERSWWFLFAGLALGICTSVRSLYGPIILAVLILQTYRDRQASLPRYRRTLTLLAGTTVGMMPMLISFFREPQVFLFNNIRYHSLDAGYLWLDAKLVEGYGGLGHVLLLLIAHGIVGLFVFHPYFTVETAIAVVGLLSWLRLRRNHLQPNPQDDLFFQLVFLMLVVYMATALVPFPLYEQYFDSPLIPFLIPFVAEGLRTIFRAREKWTFLLPAFAILLVWGEIPWESAWNSNSSDWQMASYRKVTDAIAANSASNDIVLSFWPGYVFESGRRYWPGLEDNFTYRITNKVTPAERERYHIASVQQVTDAVSSRSAALVVIAPRNVQKEFCQDLSEAERKAFDSALANNYALISRFDDVEIYRRRAANVQSPPETSTQSNGN